MRKLNKFLSIGLLLNGIFLIMNKVEFVPEFVKGICCGAGITLIFIGAYAENHDMNKLRELKKRILFRKQ